MVHNLESSLKDLTSSLKEANLGEEKEKKLLHDLVKMTESAWKKEAELGKAATVTKKAGNVEEEWEEVELRDNLPKLPTRNPRFPALAR